MEHPPVLRKNEVLMFVNQMFTSLEGEFKGGSRAPHQRTFAQDSSLLHAAVNVFGSRERADQWLREPHPELSCPPIDACTSIAGAAAVMKMLGAIANGWEV